jgi:N-acetylglucosamine kinase-like BadF-type ATPase
MAAVRAYDGRGPSTALQERLLEFFQLETMRQILPQIYHPSDGDSRMPISSFAPIVVQAASEGDAVSEDILERAGHQLGLTAVAVVRKLALCDREFALGLVGSVFKAGDLVVRPLCDVVLEAAPQARIFVNRRPPVLGAAQLALREIGKDVVVEAGRSDFLCPPAV